MHPILFKIGPLTLYSYGFMLALAFLVGSSLILREARKKNFYPEQLYNLSFLILISGILGARILYVILNFKDFKASPIEIIMLQHGGLSLFGGIFAACITSLIYLKRNKLQPLLVLDFIAPFIALAQSIGRIGCLLNGCCFGKPSVCGLYFPVHAQVLIPTQAYSSIALLLIYIILRYLQSKNNIAGKIFFLYLIFYSIKRFFMEFWRADVYSLGFLSLFQVFSILLFTISLIWLIFLINRNERL